MPQSVAEKAQPRKIEITSGAGAQQQVNANSTWLAKTVGIGSGSNVEK